MEHSTKLLFICSQNKWRSRTAEEIFRGTPGFAVKSAGTAPFARVRVTDGLVGWADEIFVMERKHRDYLQDHFADALAAKPVHVLNIPDDYQFMDVELIEILKGMFEEFLARRG